MFLLLTSERPSIHGNVLVRTKGRCCLESDIPLFEELVYANGQPVNPNIIDYRMPRFSDLPSDFETILLEDQNGPGPYGAKGIGEGGILPVASAVAEALYNAAGVRILELPLTR